jgi:ATP-dependent Lhr-like helicase
VQLGDRTGACRRNASPIRRQTSVSPHAPSDPLPPPNRDCRCPGQNRGVTPLGRFSPATQAWFEAPSPTPRPPDRRLGGDQRGQQRPGRRPDRLRQDPRGVPLVPRPPRRPAHSTRPPAAAAESLRLPMKALASTSSATCAAPLTGIRHAAPVSAARSPTSTWRFRSGDTPADERRPFAAPARHLITTPRVAGSCSSRRGRASRCAVSRRSSSTRCMQLPAPSAAPTCACPSSGSTPSSTRPAQRIGLSATGRPVEESPILGGPPGRVVQRVDQGVGPQGRRDGARNGRARPAHR